MPRVIRALSHRVTAPTALPISVQWAKDHLKSLTATEDSLIESWIVAAAETFERLTGRQLIRATWEYWLDGLPYHGRVELPRAPLLEVESVTYAGTDGTYVSFGDGASPETVSWRAVAPAGVYADPGWVEPLAGLLWPTLVTWPAAFWPAVKIRYTAGYGDDTATVPEAIKTALLLHVGMSDQFRSELHLSERSSSLEQLPMGFEHRVREFMTSPQVLQTWL